jgi:hypothetical protein
MQNLFSKETEAYAQEACAALGEGYDYNKIVSIHDLLPGKHAKSVVAYTLICAITEWENKKVDPNWMPDYREDKWNDKYYRVYWDVLADESRPSGFGLSVAHSSYDNSDSCVGSRLYFIDRETEERTRAAMEELEIAYRL